MNIDTDAIIQEIRANTARLKSCPGPHDFSIDATPAKPLFKKWACSKCGGRIEGIHKTWYELGLEHGKIKT